MDAENRYYSLFQYYADSKKLYWLLLKAQVKAESNFKPGAISPAKAIGLSQFIKGTWAEWKDGTPGIQRTKIFYSRKNPEHSIRAQAAYMKWLYNRLKFVPEMQKNDVVLAAYNWGIGNVKKLIARFGYFEKSMLPAETQKYIKRINLFMAEY